MRCTPKTTPYARKRECVGEREKRRRCCCHCHSTGWGWMSAVAVAFNCACALPRSGLSTQSQSPFPCSSHQPLHCGRRSLERKRDGESDRGGRNKKGEKELRSSNQSSRRQRMMLRRAPVSDQAAAEDALDVGAAGKPRGAAALFAAPRLLVGLGAAKSGGDCDSTARSPKSPLDLRAAFPAPGGSLLRSPRRSWDSQRVGLGGLVDTLAEPDPEAKTRMLGPQMRPSKLQCVTKSYRNTSLPKDCGLAQPELGEMEAGAGAGGMSVPCTRFYGDVKSGPEVAVSRGAQLGFSSHSTDLGKLWAPGSLPVSIGGPRRYIGSVSATEVEQSEDYTCIIAHGPNPKTIRILGDCILEPCTVRVPDGESKGIDELKEGAGAESYWLVKCSDDTGEESIRFCLSCKKNLDGKESCIYCGENAFSGGNCRDQEILNEGEHENKTVSSPNSSGSSSPFHEDDIFIDGMVVFT